MDEVALCLLSVKQPDAEELATLGDWYLSHVNWVPPPPEEEVGPESMVSCARMQTLKAALQTLEM